MAADLSLFAVRGLPDIKPGDDLAGVLLGGIEQSGIVLGDGDILVAAQKIVSKAEGRFARLAEITPSERAKDLAQKVDKDPRLVELILSESNDVVKTAPGVLIVEHKLGIVMANAGIDRSNIDHGHDGEMALLLPLDPDASARGLRAAVKEATGAEVAVVICDSIGRPWRYGTTGFAIGCAGIAPLVDQRGEVDMFGRVLEVTEPAIADEIAASACLVMGEAAEGIPAVIMRGLDYKRAETSAKALLRAKNEDLFR